MQGVSRQRLQTIDGDRWLCVPREAAFLVDDVLVRLAGNTLVVEPDKAAGVLRTLASLKLIADDFGDMLDQPPEPFDFDNR